jgi:hypothetical protein
MRRAHRLGPAILSGALLAQQAHRPRAEILDPNWQDCDWRDAVLESLNANDLVEKWRGGQLGSGPS